MRQNHAKNAHQMNVLAHVARDRSRPTRGLCARSANAAIMTQHELPVSPTFAARLAATRGSGGSCTCREARRAAHRLVALAESVLRPASRRVGEYASILSLCTSHPVLIAEEPCGHGGGPASGVSSARACHERVLPTQAGRSYEDAGNEWAVPVDLGEEAAPLRATFVSTTVREATKLPRTTLPKLWGEVQEKNFKTGVAFERA